MSLRKANCQRFARSTPHISCSNENYYSPGLAQGVSDHKPLDAAMSNAILARKEQASKQKSTEQACCCSNCAVVSAIVAVVAAVVVRTVVSVRTRAREAPSPGASWPVNRVLFAS